MTNQKDVTAREQNQAFDEYLPQPTTSVDVVEAVRQVLVSFSEQPSELEYKAAISSIVASLGFYDECTKKAAIQLDNLTEEKASDKELQKVASENSMTMNQVVGYMDMCEQLNGQMAGSGIIAVPFWFYEQYCNLQTVNEALVTQTDSLMVTLDRVEKKVASGQSNISDLGLELPQRRNIITGVTTPYIAGETGARLGDEHLDPEHIYIPPTKK